MADINLILPGDQINVFREKANTAFGEIIVGLELTPDGIFKATRLSGEVVELNFSLVFQLLAGGGNSGSIPSASPTELGTVQLYDEDDTTQITSETRVPSIATVVRLLDQRLTGLGGGRGPYNWSKSYNEEAQQLTITIITDGNTPQLRLFDMGNAQGWQVAQAVVGQTNRFSFTFTNVTQNGTLGIRANVDGTVAPGDRMPVDIYAEDFFDFSN
jgi:hypothetical protein